ncbi:hypothetical protein BU14_1502s0001 [Porphyra umbilicalis]|uniref:Uncharacterized protein n=1 Tax=Porphyra umbilicalis TaxID=2786 RepID=A0A1X6NLD4_PORUM|nr:hypothetical protein BU14_1502s0001 [Porphyra umbilicalis]|eukprot:OSX69451.1 hypothetical protein BU14_1502s0001 [Porphyra umbilicalis]
MKATRGGVHAARCDRCQVSPWSRRRVLIGTALPPPWKRCSRPRGLRAGACPFLARCRRSRFTTSCRLDGGPHCARDCSRS